MSTHRFPLEGKLIAFFHQSSDLYGSDRILLSLVEGVQNAGGDVVVLLPDAGPLTEAFAARNIEFHTVPILKLSRARYSLRGLIGLSREMIIGLPTYDRVFGSRRVHVVHSNTLAVLGGALWARRRGIPHLWHIHEIIEHPWIAARLFPRLVSAKSDCVVCNSSASFRWLLGAQPSLRKKMRVIWNGVQAPTISDGVAIAELHRKFRPGGTRLAVGLVGRINRLKGHSLLMDAVDLLHGQGIDGFSVVFIGSAPQGQEIYQTHLEKRISVSPARERIVVQGFMKNIWPTYAALDIVCLPSTEPESFGMVAAEAMAMGKPVAAARLGALCEVVVDGSTGLTFTPQDAHGLAAALKRLLVDDAIRVEMGRAGQERASTEYSVDRMTEHFVKTYAEMTAQKE